MYQSVLKLIILGILLSDTLVQPTFSDEEAAGFAGEEGGLSTPPETDKKNAKAETPAPAVNVDVQVTVEDVQNAVKDGKLGKTATLQAQPDKESKETDPVLSGETNEAYLLENKFKTPKTEYTTGKDADEESHDDGGEHLDEPYEISIHHSVPEPGEKLLEPEADKNPSGSMEETRAWEPKAENLQHSEGQTQPQSNRDQPEPNTDNDSNVMKEGDSSSASQDRNPQTLTTVLDVEEIDDSRDECDQIREPLKRLGSTSKFFFENTRLHNFREARELCSKYDLVIAEVEGLADHRTLESFTSQSNAGTKYFIGLNDIKTEGLFRHADGRKITFQNFLASQPDDQNMTEDCVTMMKESKHSPAGAADYDCNKTAYVFCMFSKDSQCYSESYEEKENQNLTQHRGLRLLMNGTERTFHLSNFQATWKDAMYYCSSKAMALLNLDNGTSMAFFRVLLKREKEFVKMPMSTVQYWTSGKFKKSHMSAPIIWHTKPELTESEERGVVKHNGSFSFSGLFNWSTKKRTDPGGPHGWRRDLCVSFGFDNKPYETPFLRNTNCDLPNYFICYAENSDEDPLIEFPEGHDNSTGTHNDANQFATVDSEGHEKPAAATNDAGQVASVNSEGHKESAGKPDDMEKGVTVNSEGHEETAVKPHDSEQIASINSGGHKESAVKPHDLEQIASIDSEGHQNLATAQEVADQKTPANSESNSQL